MVDESLDHRRSLASRSVQALDLSGTALDWARIDVTGTVFPGCTFPGPKAELSLLRRGAFVFPGVG